MAYTYVYGAGTSNDPYQIHKLEDLNGVREYLTSCFILSENLDFADNTCYFNVDNKAIWTTNTGWEPIGTVATPFAGSFDGNKKTINHLFINRTSDYVGLFGASSDTVAATIKDLGVINVAIVGDDNVGGLIGSPQGASIIECCFTTGSVTGGAFVGGLIGYNGGLVQRCYSLCSIAGGSYAGGLVGRNSYSNIYDSYACGSVAGTSYNAGFVGSMVYGTISRCYSTGTAGSSYGFCAVNDGGAINDCFWDILSSGANDSVGGIGKTTTEMYQQATYIRWHFTADGDITAAWNIVNGESYPSLNFDIIAAGTPPTEILDIKIRSNQAGTGVYISCRANTGYPLAGTISYGTTSLLGNTTEEVLGGGYTHFSFYIPWPSGGEFYYKIHLYETDNEIGVWSSTAVFIVSDWVPVATTRSSLSLTSSATHQKLTPRSILPPKFLPCTPTCISHAGEMEDNIKINAKRPALVFSARDFNYNDKIHFVLEINRCAPDATITANTLSSTIGFDYSVNNGETWLPFSSEGSPQGALIRYIPQQDLEDGLWTWRVKATDNDLGAATQWAPLSIERTVEVQSSSWASSGLTLLNSSLEASWSPLVVNREPLSQNSSWNSSAEVQVSSIVGSNMRLFLDAGNRISFPYNPYIVTPWYDISGIALNTSLTSVAYDSSNGGIMSFNGSSSYGTIPAGIGITTDNTPVSLAAWINVNAISGTQTIIGDYYSTGTAYYSCSLAIDSAGKIVYQPAGRGTTWTVSALSTSSINTAAWYYVVATYNATRTATSANIKIYINGIEETTTISGAFGTAGTIQDNWRIGKQYNSINYFNGKIGHIIVYNKALTSLEINQNFNATKTRFGI